MKKEEKGITLIVLIITAVVLIILVGVSISLVSAKNGVLTKASDSVTEYQKMSAQEDVQLAFRYSDTEYYTNSINVGIQYQYLEFYSSKVSDYLNKIGKFISLEDFGNKEWEIIYEKYGKEYTFIVDKNRNIIFKKEEDVRGKENGNIILDTATGTVAYGTANHTFTINTNHGGKLSVIDDNSIAESEINGTTVTLSNLETLDIGTEIIVTVNCASTSKYKEATATYVLTVEKANLSTPEVSIDTEGKVLWENVIEATGYEISFNNSEWESATSGSYSIDTASTGNKTVYVRAVTTNEYYNTPSNVGSAIVAVYSLTLNKTTGISSVSGSGNYVAGKKVTITATLDLGYNWNRWNVKSGTTPSSVTTTQTTLTINANTVLDATATERTVTLKVQQNCTWQLYSNPGCTAKSGTTTFKKGNTLQAVHITGNTYRLKSNNKYIISHYDYIRQI